MVFYPNDFSATEQLTFPSPSFYDVIKEREMPTKVTGGGGKWRHDYLANVVRQLALFPDRFVTLDLLYR